MAVIDLSFVLVGTTIPLDHGYSLFSALSRIVPELHGDRRVGVHPIRGRQSAPGVLSLTERSRLKIRLPAESLAPYIAIAGKELDLNGHHIRVGIPQVEALVPAANLAARLVTFNHALDAEAFEADVRREMARMEIAATPQLIPGNSPKHPGQPIRRVVRIKGRRMVAYPVRCRFDNRRVHSAARRWARRAEADGVRVVQSVFPSRRERSLAAKPRRFGSLG
jgi:CRISPR-associated protein Cas6